MATLAMAGESMERMHSQRPGLGRNASIAEKNRELYEQQRARRRGPTPEMFFTKHLDNSRIVKADDPERRREMRSFTVATSIFFLLTMTYVWQHFSAIETGYKIESQKTYVEKLREDNRQLRLSEAQLSDPGRIDTIAKQLGLNEPMPGQVVRPENVSTDGAVVAQMQAPVLPQNAD